MITHSIHTEDSSVHWTYFDTINQNVLDLGCGRWHSNNYEELSPIYFGRTADKVIGVDANGGCIDFYIDYTNNDSKFTFIYKHITDVNEVREWLVKYNITALKCDIEGDEKLLLDLTTDDLINVKELAIEYHNDSLKQDFLIKAKEWGFNLKAEGKFVNVDNMGVLFYSKSFKN